MQSIHNPNLTFRITGLTPIYFGRPHTFLVSYHVQHQENVCRTFFFFWGGGRSFHFPFQIDKTLDTQRNMLIITDFGYGLVANMSYVVTNINTCT